MGPDSHPSGTASVDADGSCRSQQELSNEEVAEHDPRRQPHKPHEEERHDGENFRAGIEQEVRAHYAGDGAAGSDCGDGRVEIEDCVHSHSGNSADEVENDVAEVAEVVFDVVAEDPEREHVEDEVHPGAVQEHGREDG